jgi:DNA-binding LacI/PurR family transcriptional regulator
MPPTLADVARQAGVSAATASRVLNGRRYVSVVARDRVELAARALRYVPNRAARDLSLARTYTIAFLTHHAQYPTRGEGTFGSRVLHGAARRAAAHGFDLLFSVVDDRQVEHLADLPATHASRADGLLLLGPTFPTDAIRGLANRPMVLVDNRLPDSSTDAVLARNRSAAAALTRHLLLDHGYRRVACIAGPQAWPSTEERLDGYRSAMVGADAEPIIVHAAETTMRHGADAFGALAERLPEAVVAINDALALGAMHRARSLRRSRRPAFVGFDDIAWAQMADPPLTTAAIDAEAMGEIAAELLVERLAHPGEARAPREERVPTSLRIRQSCGCIGETRTVELIG